MGFQSNIKFTNFSIPSIPSPLRSIPCGPPPNHIKSPIGTIKHKCINDIYHSVTRAVNENNKCMLWQTDEYTENNNYFGKEYVYKRTWYEIQFVDQYDVTQTQNYNKYDHHSIISLPQVDVPFNWIHFDQSHIELIEGKLEITNCDYIGAVKLQQHELGDGTLVLQFKLYNHIGEFESKHYYFIMTSNDKIHILSPMDSIVKNILKRNLLANNLSQK